MWFLNPGLEIIKQFITIHIKVLEATSYYLSNKNYQLLQIMIKTNYLLICICFITLIKTVRYCSVRDIGIYCILALNVKTNI